MTQSILALYLSHVEASLAFNDDTIAGVVLDENRVVSLTSRAQAQGVTLGMDRRTAQAFVNDLRCFSSNPEGVQAWIDRLTHFVPHSSEPLHIVFNPLETDSLLITMPWQDDLASAVATLGAMSPNHLRLGVGESERVAFVSALTQNTSLTESTLRSTLVKTCLASEKVPETLTLGDLMHGSQYNTPAIQNLHATLLGDWNDDEWIDTSKDLALTWTLNKTDTSYSQIRILFKELAQSVSLWMHQHHKTCLGLTVTLQGVTEDKAFKLDLTDAAPDSILKVVLDALSHQTFEKSLQAIKVEHTHAVQPPQQPSPGSLAAKLQSRFGDKRVFMLSHHESPLPEASSHRDPVPHAHTASPLMARDAIDPARPIFLLKTPIALHTQHGELYWEGAPIVGLTHPTQYRDHGTVRHYCVAHASDGRRLWIYRQRDDWFLHGFFA